MTLITTSAFNFLKKVKKNNNREWFKENKGLYEAAYADMIAFADAFLLEMNKIDNIENPTGKRCLHRIYRDTRFSKDKTPYKKNWGGGFKRASKALRGGYYFHIEPGNSFLGGGFWGPSSQDLRHIRQHIAQDDQPLRKIINSKKFKTAFGELKGEKLKTAPKGYPKDHPSIDLLNYKQFLLMKSFSDKEVLDKKFLKEATKTFKNFRPFFDYMSETLTTDLNGVSMI